MGTGTGTGTDTKLAKIVRRVTGIMRTVCLPLHPSALWPS